jgi:hypothetical protein
MPKKSLISIYLNEFNYEYLISGARQYNCENILKLLKKKKIITKTNDQIQNKNLDPWVQNVSINVGVESRYHKIYNLGEDIYLKRNQVWDILAKKKKKILVWGPMNAKLRDNQKIYLFFPDPWNSNQKVKPQRLRYLSLLPNYYARNYLKPNKFKLIKYGLLFFIGLILNGYSIRLGKFTPYLIRTFFFKGLNNYLLFLLLDLIAVIGLKEETKRFKPDFSFIFLNSIAHYQHNHWNELSEQKTFFQFLNIICSELNLLNNYYDTKLIFNAFSQRKTKNIYILRPKNPEKFLTDIGINFLKLNQNMTNGGLIFFRNNKEKNKGLYILRKTKLGRFFFFETHVINNITIFYRIQVISNIAIENINISDIFKYLTYDKKIIKQKNILNCLNMTQKNFLSLSSIKSTGAHVNYGLLLYENINIKKKYIKKKKLFNHTIFKIILDYFNE